MGIFGDMFRSNHETRDQKRQRIIKQAIQDDREIRFAKNYNRVLNAFMKGTLPGFQKGEPDDVFVMYVLGELFKEVTGAHESQYQLEANFLARMDPTEFRQRVQNYKNDIFEQISETLHQDLNDPVSAQILNALPHGSYIQVFRRGVSKTIQLFEQNGLHQDAQEMKKGFQN